ncbi:WD40 repeat-like protein, partial [Vararia minispora EC-137]
PVMAATTAYIAASVNRFNHAASSSTESFIAFGSGKLVALWDTSDLVDRGVTETLAAHDARITCVKFLDEKTFASADDAGIVKIWMRTGRDTKWDVLCSFGAHRKSISSLAYHAPSHCLITGSSDATVRAWACSDGFKILDELQTLSLNGRYPLSIALETLPGSSAVVLAIGCTDRVVQVFMRSEGLFVPAAQLPGHEDWIRALAFLPPSSSYTPLTLASGSQDATIRLWTIEPIAKAEPAADADELLDAFEAALGEVGDAEEGGRQITLKRHIAMIRMQNGGVQQYSITFDALLIGHEAGITSLAWRPPISSISTPTLLSSSIDSSLILWSPSSIPSLPTPSSTGPAMTSLWINCERFGDVGGQRLGGFVGGLWLANGREVLAWGWSGGTRRWRMVDVNTQTRLESGKWVEVGALTGHLGPVRGISWAPDGEYLLSTGLDQTTRIHAEFSGAWHELARPQVHGYDLVGAAFLNALRFVSVADEKVARVFEAPRGFVRTVRALGVADLTVDEGALPVSAMVPPLGLSNKASTDESTQALERATARPFEGELSATTLWPETEKVFGHGYESITVAVSSAHDLVATACKATTPKHAVVRLYDAATLRPYGSGAPLEGHALTVTRIAFSPDDRFMLSVSRDRTWRLFERVEGKGYIPTAADKSHGRIIWDCSWASDGSLFATASRDKTVKVWQPQSGGSKKWKAAATIKLEYAATAVTFAPNEADRRILAVGLETGVILIYSSALSSPGDWKGVLAVVPGMAHVEHVHQLAWRPRAESRNGDGSESERQLASCSDDGTVKILNVKV